MSQGIFLRKYGVQTTVDFDLFEIDGVDFKVDAAHAAGDTKVMKNEGAEANTSNGFTDEGQGYSIVLSATEMQAARVKVYVVDQGTKAWLDTSITIETYGHASAMHAIDLDDSVRAGLTALPNAAADAAGGLPISDAGDLDIDTKLANTNEITVARMGALTDWINGGRLDLILDIIAADVVNIDGAAMRGTDNAALASVVGALADAAAAGEVTSADTLMQYIKQLINILIGTAGIGTFPAEAAPGNAVSLAEVIRAIHTDVTGLNGDAMRGTDGANTTVPDAAGTAPTAAEIQAEMEENGASILDTLRDDLADGGRTDLLIDAILGDTNELQTDWANGGRLDTIIDAILTDTNELQTDDVPGLIGALNNLAVTDILADSTAFNGAELNPATAGKMAYYISKLNIAWLNKELITEANGNLEQFDDSDVSVGTIASALTSDGTHTTRLRLVQ